MGSSTFEVFLLNTGRVGGTDDEAASKKIQIEDSGAVVKAIAEETIRWERDPDFGYEVATAVPGIDDPELLQPRRLYERTGRSADYAAWVTRYKRERLEFLEGYPGLLPEILEAVR
jgi:phosphoenolpyruvate carboxykinase (ATP)